MNFVRPWLAIANYRESADSDLFRQHYITALLHLSMPVMHPDLQCRPILIDDCAPIPPAKLQDAIAWMHTLNLGHDLTNPNQDLTQDSRQDLAQSSGQDRLVIACGAGIS